MDQHSIYIHIPFCARRCLYCDFDSFAGQEDRIPEYVAALCRELIMVGRSHPTPIGVHTIYFGGGTPSLLQAGQIEKILSTVKQAFAVSKNAEITLESNPGTITPAYLTDIRNLGINRLSIGAQSALARELEMLGRIHSPEDIQRAYSDARQAGFENINLDFIYGLPGQTFVDWQESLDFAIECSPEHLSMYALTLEHATPMSATITAGRLPELDDDIAADCYEMTMDCLEKAGYIQYEISNWALFQKEELKTCTHNLQYWRHQPYLGFGTGAHGYSHEFRTANVTSIEAYIDRMKTDICEQFPFSTANEIRTYIDLHNRIQEAMMLGLRLTVEGVARSHFIQQYQHDYYELFKDQIELLLSQDLLEWKDHNKETLRLTRRGRLLGNRVFMQFVGE